MLREQAKKAQEQPEKELQKVQQQTKNKSKLPAIGGVELSSEQWKTLKEGGFIYLENMKKKDGNGLFSLYVFLNDEKNKAFFSRQNPNEFVKYGRYEMRIRDKILIESGYITKAKVKWYGIGTFAYPYLWKSDKSDMEYKESWDDPRLPKPQKVEKKPDMPTIIQKKNKGRKI
ncbi:DUF3945 domain-containing protein [Dysgonomonas sp. GY75]|uniref:DUF3945 domain-containing protein n=1 Tax=Dysgonomonas sp. GY75 TaxID=2780419 RepID=UPI001F548F6D|nr:DUF3945 domain-containing protein [Dysgonomonas sp. GY75]